MLSAKQILSLPYTLWFNLKCFPLRDALKLRVRIAYDVSVKNCHKGCIVFLSPQGRLNIGFSEGSFRKGRNQKGFLNFGETGTVVVKETAWLAAGIVLNVNGVVSFGRKFGCNANLLIACANEICFGDDIAIGWDVTVTDDDGHDILCASEKINCAKKIEIGNHCWLCSKATVLKGVVLKENTVIAFGSIVSKAQEEGNILIAGVPGKIVKKGIDWKH